MFFNKSIVSLSFCNIFCKLIYSPEIQGNYNIEFGKTVYQSLLNIMLDEDYGDITDPTEGRDVKVICTKAPGRMWATTEVRPRGKQSKLNDNSAAAKEWMSNIPNLDDLYSPKSYDELEKLVNDWLNGDESSDTDGTSRGTAKLTTLDDLVNDDTTPKEPQAKYKSLDEAFADLEDM